VLKEEIFLNKIQIIKMLNKVAVIRNLNSKWTQLRR
jgi:hypothetical protein